MSKREDGGPAFPRGSASATTQSGMSLRDWFAGQVLAGMASRERLIVEEGPCRERAARICYALADAMIAVREETR